MASNNPAARPLQEIVSALTVARRELAEREQELQAEWQRGVVLQRMLGALHTRSSLERRWRARLSEVLYFWKMLVLTVRIADRIAATEGAEAATASVRDEGRRAQLQAEAKAAEADVRADA